MAGDTVIQIDSLRTIINGILDFIEKDLGQTEVELGKDHYWEVLDRFVFEIPAPSELGAGSLIDDWEFLQSAITNKEHRLPISLIHVAPILHALSQAVPSFVSPNEPPVNH